MNAITKTTITPAMVALCDIGDGILDLMIVGEIMQSIRPPEDSDQVAATHIHWLGRKVSDLANVLRNALDELEPPTRGAGPDDALIRLGGELEEAWDAAAAVAGSAAEEHATACLSSLVDRIAELRATTLRGVLVKRRALAWIEVDDRITAESLSDTQTATTDMRLIAGILDSLTSLAAAQAGEAQP